MSKKIKIEASSGNVFLDLGFDPAEAEVFPEDWLVKSPGKRIASVLIRVEFLPENESEVLNKLEDWFVPTLFAASGRW